MPVGTSERVGTDLGGYRIRELRGHGGMGDVFLADDLRLGRRVALKLVSPELAGDGRFRERFLRESRLAASLDHPNVIPVYEAGEVDGALYISMRFVEGTDLRRMLATHGPLESARALAILESVAAALDTAHAHGLIHRDVKPSNVLVSIDPRADPPEHVYLSDFGLTREPGPTEAGFLGTAEYAAPELVTQAPVEGRTDEYALACVLFECLTGEPPFRGSLMGVLWSHVNDAPPAATDRNPALPEELDTVLTKALAKDPEDRFESCRALLAATRQAFGEAAPARRPSRRRRTMLLASLAGALAVAAASAVLLARGAGDRPLLGQSDSLARIDAETGAVTGIPAGNAPSGVAAGRSAVWVGNEAAGTLSSVDLRTGGVDEFQLGETPLSIAAYDRTIAVVSGPFQHLLTVVDEASRRVLGKVPLDLSAATTGFVAPARVAAGREGIWLLNVNEWALRRLELADGTPELSGPFPLSTPDEPAGTVAGISVGEGAVWVTGDADYRVLLQFDPATGRRVRRIELSFAPKRVAAGEGAVWVTDALEDYVWRVDAKTLEQTRIPVGGGPRSVAAGFGAVWVVSALGGSVSRIDPDTSTVASTVALGEGVEDVAVGAGGIWVTVDAG